MINLPLRHSLRAGIRLSAFFPKFICYYLFLFAMATNCSNTASKSLAPIKIPSIKNPSAGSPVIGGPVGYDALSSSTNFSEKLFDPSQKADALSGAAFVAPPQINNYGAVSFSYPLEIPPGRAGIEPQISLSYSSSGGDGWLGIGWSLGMGSIVRTTKYGQPFYDSRDTFTYNGKRLIKVSGSLTSEDGQYRPEIEDGSFTRLELVSSVSGGIWTVYDSTGRQTLYGAALSERTYRPDDNTKTYTWNFSKTIDINGNSMTAIYDTAEYALSHMLYLQELRYTANDSMGQSAKQFVKFNLIQRSDSYVSTAGGFIQTMNKLLDSIEVGNIGTVYDSVLWSYQMVYAVSADSGRPLLQTIESTKNSTKPQFTYQPPGQTNDHSLIWQNQYNPWASDPETNPEVTKYFEGDFNGDGISDMAFFNPKTGDWKVVESRFDGGRNFKTYANNFAGYEGENKIQWFKGNVTGDYDGNGKSDIAFYLPEKKEFWVAESTGSIFQFKNYGKLAIQDVDIFKCEWFTGDYDGNGISDVVLFDEKSGSWIFMVNTGGAFSFIQFAANFKNLYRDDYSSGLSLNSPYTMDRTPEGKSRNKIHWLGGDYNGDGRSDIAFYDERSGKWWVAENYRDDNYPGGFRLDWKLYQVFNAPAQSLFSHERYSGDFDGDGFSDFLVYDRSQRQWWLGKTTKDPYGNSTINFTMWSAIPGNQDITRWLQGDFNGDGRTDIGFYSKTDNKFWIGEATPAGFRYRIYSDLSYGGPDSARVMAAPLPIEEVQIKENTIYLPDTSANKTSVTTYSWDANPDQNHGEIPFTGCFTTSCTGNNEILLFDKFRNIFTFQGPGLSMSDAVSFTLNPANSELLTPTRPIRNPATGKDEILIYETDGTNHYFKRIHYNGGFVKTDKAVFPVNGNITNFNIKESAYLVSEFGGDQNLDILILNDQAATANFQLFTSAGQTTLTIASSNLTFTNIFRAGTSGTNRNQKNLVDFFSVDIDKDGLSEIIVLDRRSGGQNWYIGKINTATKIITINKLNPASTLNPPLLPTDGSAVMPAFNRGVDIYSGTASLSNELLYTTVNNGITQFHRIAINMSGSTIDIIHYSQLSSDYSFHSEFNHLHQPIIHTPNGIQVMDFISSSAFNLTAVSPTDPNYTAVKIDRPDLYTKVYTFQWIQGDYNGDSKTDIGIFHLKESQWYFAMSQGTVPDMIYMVDNGIGGKYTFEYKNSTSFDNSGTDTIPDLPMNYKVCTKLTISDGMGQDVYNTYDYKNGFAFSAYINGKKETDFFGFSNFTKTDPQGSRTEYVYNTAPYTNFLLNRALAGALKEVRFIGYDSREYSRTQTDYAVHEIHPNLGIFSVSYLVYPSQTRKYINNILTTTSSSTIDISATDYLLLGKTSTTTDHYSDTAHPAYTKTSYSAFEFNAAANQQRVQYSIDNFGTAFETRIDYTYDAKGNVIEKRNSYSGSGLPAVSPVIMQYEYDGFGNLTAEQNASQGPARRTEFSYDTIYNQFLVSTSQIGPVTLTQNTDYDLTTAAFANPVKITDPNGNSHYFSYDTFGRISSIKADTESGKKLLSSYIYSSDGSNLTLFPLSAKTTQYTGSGPAIKTRVFTDGAARVIHTVQSATTTAGKLYTKSGKIIYDALGRVIRKSQSAWARDNEIDVFAASNTEKFPTITDYDASGRIKKITAPKAYAGEAETSITTLYTDPWEFTVTDSMGKAKKTVKNARGETLYIEEFNNNDSLRSRMGFCYDASGNTIRRMDLNASAITCPSEVTPNAVPVSRDTSGNNVSNFLYDAFGNLIESNDPDMGHSIMAYDAFGQITSRTDALNQATTFAYDSLGRLTQKILPGSEGTVNFTYDSLAGSNNAIGKLTVMEDSAQKKEFGYDKLGHRNMERRYLKDPATGTLEAAFETQFDYDLAGRTTKIQYPQDPVELTVATVCYGYNSFGFVTSVNLSWNPGASACNNTSMSIITNIGYNEFGQVESIDRGNGVSTNYTYDIKGRITRLLSQGIDSNTGLTRTLQDSSYSYLANNNIAAVENRPSTNGIGAGQTRFEYTYDGLNRLIDAKGQYLENGFGSTGANDKTFQRKYEYAANGNLTAKEERDFATGNLIDRWNYSYDNHRAVSIQSSTTGSGAGQARFLMSYDNNGNMLSKEDNKNGLLKTMQYDSYNRIRKVTDAIDNKLVGNYYYDDQGFRVRKISEKTDPASGQIITIEMKYQNRYYGFEHQVDSGGNEILNTHHAVNNVYMNGVRIAAVTAKGQTRYYLSDQVDSVHVVMNEAGEALARSEYLPYGEEWVKSGNTNYNGKFNGQELDTESGFYYYNARHYDPQIGRFVSADTVVDGAGSTAGWNRYMYVHGNPVTGKDPTGHSDVSGAASDFSSYMKNNKSRTTATSPKTSPQSTQMVVNSTTNTQSPKQESVEELEAILNKGKSNTDERVNLKKGFHIIMLENYFKDSGIKLGDDKINGKYFIIKDGKVLKTGYGTSESSSTPELKSKYSKSDINKGNNILPGDYFLSTTQKTTTTPKADLSIGHINIYKNEESFKSNDRTMPSTKNGQNLIQGHDSGSLWSGSLGCQVMLGFKKWAKEYSEKNGPNISGQYHLRDMNALKED